MKTKKISYTVPTLVLTWVCRPWVIYHDNTQTTLPELISPKQPWWSESQSPHIRPLSQVRSQESVVLRNHHRVLMTSHHHILYIPVSHIVTSSKPYHILSLSCNTIHIHFQAIGEILIKPYLFGDSSTTQNIKLVIIKQ